MKSIKDANWIITIHKTNFDRYIWSAFTWDDISLAEFNNKNNSIIFWSDKSFLFKDKAIKSWIKFAKINEIKNYEIKGV